MSWRMSRTSNSSLPVWPTHTIKDSIHPKRKMEREAEKVKDREREIDAGESEKEKGRERRE